MFKLEYRFSEHDTCLKTKWFNSIKTLSQFVRRNKIRIFKTYINNEPITYINNTMITLKTAKEIVSQLSKKI